MSQIFTNFRKRIDWKMFLISLSIPYLVIIPVDCFLIESMMFIFRETIMFAICCNLILSFLPLSIDFFFYHEYFSFYHQEPISASYLFGKEIGLCTKENHWKFSELKDIQDKDNRPIEMGFYDSKIPIPDFPEIKDGSIDDYSFDYLRQILLLELSNGECHKIDFSEID